MDALAHPRTFERATETVQYIRSQLPEVLQHPKVGIICGSGLGGLADTIESEPKVELSYSDIPHFPRSTVVGHAGKMVFGLAGASKLPVAILVGRAHYYEGHSMDAATFATRVCKVLGVETMIVTNAAGGLNPAYAVGDIVCLNDHMFMPGFAGVNPLRGPNIEEFGTRFPPLSDAYDLPLRVHTHLSWKKLGLDKQKRSLHEGIYAMLVGPTYETRAEVRMLRAMGADLVGMSTAPEVIVARHSGMRVLAFSLVTNSVIMEAGPRGDDEAVQAMSKTERAEFMGKGKANHEEVLEAGREAAKDMVALVNQILSDYNEV